MPSPFSLSLEVKETLRREKVRWVDVKEKDGRTGDTMWGTRLLHLDISSQVFQAGEQRSLGLQGSGLIAMSRLIMVGTPQYWLMQVITSLGTG